MKNRLTYREQIQLAYDKAAKEKNVEAMAYYHGVTDTCASVSFETFKGSWVYEQWIKRDSTKKVIETIQGDLARFSYLGR